MKSYNGLFEKMLDINNIKQCILDASKSKKKRSDVKRVINNIDKHVIKVHEVLYNGKFQPSEHKPQTINKNSDSKTREIIKPSYKYEQIVHHCIVSQFAPIVLRSSYAFSCGSIPGRGPHYGKKYMKKWIRSYKGKKFYVLKMDIRHFYESVDRDILKEMLHKRIRDKRFLNLMYTVIDGGGEKGLPLGYYTSQWFGNFYLQELDYFIKQTLGAEHYMRYMDDMVILGKNKKQLHRICNAIKEFLNKRLHLTLKSDWQVFRFEYIDRKTGKTRGRFIDFMGFTFHHNRICLRKSILKKAVRKARKIARKKRQGKPVTWYDAQQMISYLGWFKHTDTYGYFQRTIKQLINVQQLKRKISNHQRRENQKNDRMARTNWNTITETC